MISRSAAPFRCSPPGWGGSFAYRLAAALLVAALGVVTALPARSTAAGVQPQALVLDPFPEQHGAGYTAQDAVTLLQSAGFRVTDLEGTQVTVPVMMTLSHYAVIYVFTHSGPLPNNDAAVATGDTRHAMYKKYFRTQSLVEMHIMSDHGFRYFDAVTGRFIDRYTGKFSPHSIVFLNACTALGMTQFWVDLKKAGVGTLISWRHHVNNTDADVGAHEVLAALARGESVSQAIRQAFELGAGISVVKGKLGTLAYTGDGGNTFARATSGALTAAR
ncbi:MAG TPA: hypothetical protein VFB58_14430 [Chloroflexota bacterium]|nr:hypothetical protein [Chloroflexota bacterium]